MMEAGVIGRTENATYFADVPTRPVLLDPDASLNGLRNSAEFFINFFMAENLTLTIPPFHIDIFNKMISPVIKKLALAIPRGHSKTTLAKLAVVYHFLFTDYSFILYTSNTASIAQNACVDIITFMKSQNFNNLFPGGLDFSFELGIERPGEGYYIFRFKIPGTDRYKTCILKALGAGQQVRGMNILNRRPEMFIVDDLEDDDNTANLELQRKLKRWVYGPFIKAANKLKLKIIWLGNWLSNTCILKDLCESKNWVSYRYGCILQNGQPLWPEMWSLESLKEDYEEYVRNGLEDLWFAEMMNIIIPRRNGVIKKEEIYYAPQIDPASTGQKFITIDPAISEKKWADKTAILVHAYNEQLQIWQIVDGHIERGMNPKQIFDKTMEFVFDWQVKVIGIEEIAFQKALKFFFEHLLAEYQEHNIEVIGLPGGVHKTERISSWAAMMKQRRYAITEGTDLAMTLTDQLLNYNPANKHNDDDGIDAAANGEHVIMHYIGLIQSKIANFFTDLHKPLWLGARCAV